MSRCGLPHAHGLHRRADALRRAARCREQRVREMSVPPFFSYEADRGETELSVLLGLLRHKTTAAAWEWRILWLFRFSGGDADRLEEVEW